MPAKYDQGAIDLCRNLYHKYGGKNHDAIEAEMQRVYPGWRKGNLYDRGKKQPRLGWITNYGFDNTLAIYTQKLTKAVNSDEEDLYIGIRTTRQELQEKVTAGTATKDQIYQYRDFCKLEIDARKNLNLSRDNFDTFVAGYEKLVMWLGDIDPAAAKLLIKSGERLAELAQAHYGKAEENDDGALAGADEGGNRPGPD